MNHKQTLILTAVLSFISILIYSIHTNYALPFHIDEWHHITESIKLTNGSYSAGISGVKIGFHLFLSALGAFVNLISMHQFLPAFWAVLSGLVIFFTIKSKSKSFYIALFSVLFFGSIKSNANITGLWFFTPLVFSIPLIFLYIFFFTEGLEKQNKKFILYSLAIMLILLFTHSISILFALPFLAIYSILHKNYIIKEKKFFSLFLIIPIIGVLLISNMLNLSIIGSLGFILKSLQFKYGWGVLEIKNSFLELYSTIGYLMAILGIFFIVKRKQTKKYLPYILWTATMFLMILIYRFTGTSYLTPYQRNLYYFALSLPLLSGIGLYYTVNTIKNKFRTRNSKKIISLLLIILVFMLTFINYYKIPDQITVYQLISEREFLDLQKIEDLINTNNKVMAPADISSTMYATIQKKPVGSIYFYGDRTQVEKFYLFDECKIKETILDQEKASFIISRKSINCGWEKLFDNNLILYKK